MNGPARSLLVDKRRATSSDTATEDGYDERVTMVGENHAVVAEEFAEKKDGGQELLMKPWGWVMVVMAVRVVRVVRIVTAASRSWIQSLFHDWLHCHTKARKMAISIKQPL